MILIWNDENDCVYERYRIVEDYVIKWQSLLSDVWMMDHPVMQPGAILYSMIVNERYKVRIYSNSP